MAEILNKRIMPALAAEARENARRYWAKKAANHPADHSASSRPEGAAGKDALDDQNLPGETK